MDEAGALMGRPGLMPPGGAYGVGFRGYLDSQDLPRASAAERCESGSLGCLLPSHQCLRDVAVQSWCRLQTPQGERKLAAHLICRIPASTLRRPG